MQPLPFKYGKVYAVKGTPSQLSWELELAGLHPQLVIQPVLNAEGDRRGWLNQLRQLTESEAIDEEAYTVVTRQVPSDLRVAETKLVCLLLSELDGSLNEEASKLYKQLCNGSFVQVDLSQRLPLYWESFRAEGLLANVSEADQEWLKRHLGPYPKQLRWHLQQGIDTLYLPQVIQASEVSRLFEVLGTPEYLTHWSQIPNRLLYGLFLQRPSNWLYDFLSRRCAALYLYLDPVLQKCEGMSADAVRAQLKLFATWVYLSSTLWKEKPFHGMNRVNRGNGKEFWTFNPSKSAQLVHYRWVTNQLSSEILL